MAMTMQAANFSIKLRINMTLWQSVYYQK